MAGSVAGTIQGEAGSNPANQFAVASTIWNRLQAGTYGGSASAIVNAPNQYVGYASPNASAREFAAAIENGTFGNYGNPGNAVNFRTAGYVNASNPNSPGSQMGTGGYNIGGNAFSDREGAPSAAFVPPSYGGNLPEVPNYGGTFLAPDLGANGGGNAAQYLDPYATGGNVPIDSGDGYASGLTTNSFRQEPFDVSSISSGLSGDFRVANDFADYGGGGTYPGPGIWSAIGVNPFGSFDAPSSTPDNPLAGVTSSPSQAQGDFFQNVFNLLGNFFTRAGLIILAIILLGIGLWAMARGDIGSSVKKALT